MLSISSLQSNINRINSDIADLQKKIGVETSKEATAQSKIVSAQRAISRTKSLSTIKSKHAEIERCQSDIARANKSRSDLQNKIANKSKDLLRYQQLYSKEVEAERKKQVEVQRKLDSELVVTQRNLASELAHQRKIIENQTQPVNSQTSELKNEHPKYDVFISHATEDKEGFVRPLIKELDLLGVTYFFDEISIGWGDSLRQTIDKGLVNSRYGIVVISTAFINKRWPAYELDGLINREMNGENKVVLPVWHKVTVNEVAAYSPAIANRRALNSSVHDFRFIAKTLKDML